MITKEATLNCLIISFTTLSVSGVCCVVQSLSLRNLTSKVPARPKPLVIQVMKA